MINIIDYQSGNTKSLKNAINFLGFDCKITNKIADIENSHSIILPGVGSYNQCINSLRENNLEEVLYKQVIEKKTFFLGICVGLQILSDYGYENEKTKGLGWIRGDVKIIEKKKDLSIPHIGWNEVKIKEKNRIFKSFDQNPNFYFVHSYVLKPEEDNLITSTSFHGDEFVSSIEKENIFGVQFHPEKSQFDGLKILKNFLELS
jgi:imidazole glycerol-phosphate synthase subunit HisH